MSSAVTDINYLCRLSFARKCESIFVAWNKFSMIWVNSICQCFSETGFRAPLHLIFGSKFKFNGYAILLLSKFQWSDHRLLSSDIGLRVYFTDIVHLKLEFEFEFWIFSTRVPELQIKTINEMDPRIPLKMLFSISVWLGWSISEVTWVC